MRVPVVFDNLIHRGEMPVTVGVFVDPGKPRNRNAENDTFSDAYATFLVTEILPNVATTSQTIPTNGPSAAGVAAGTVLSPSPGCGLIGSGAS